MDYYKVNTDPTKSPTEEFANLVNFYQSGEQQEEKPVNTAESPVSRSNADSVNSESPESPPAKPAGFWSRIVNSFKEGAARATRENESRKSNSGNAASTPETSSKKTSGAASTQETAKKRSSVLQKADDFVTSGAQKVDHFLRKV